jgi:hypothetical protein
MDKRGIEELEIGIGRARTASVAGAALGVSAGLLAAFLGWFGQSAALPAALVSLALLSYAVLTRVANQHQLESLATDPGAYALPDVRALGKRLVTDTTRRRLAGWLWEVIREAGQPGSLYLEDRVRAHSHQLRALARDLSASNVVVQATSMATCVRLLTSAAESPLYNPNLPAEQLMSMLFRIRLGVVRVAD